MRLRRLSLRTAAALLLAVVALAPPAQAEEPGSGERPGAPPPGARRRLDALPPQEREQVRERWRKATPEERRELRGALRERLGDLEPALKDYLRGLVICSQHLVTDTWPVIEPPAVPIFMNSPDPENAERELRFLADASRQARKHMARLSGLMLAGYTFDPSKQEPWGLRNVATTLQYCSTCET